MNLFFKVLSGINRIILFNEQKGCKIMFRIFNYSIISLAFYGKTT